jgi:hypothetical protein
MRLWANDRWPGWPPEMLANDGAVRIDGETTVQWRTLSSPTAAVREIVVDEPFAAADAMRQRTTMLVGWEGVRAFVHIEVALRSLDVALMGKVVFDNEPPGVIAALVQDLRALDAASQVTSSAIPLGHADAARFGKLIMDPARRLPVLLFVLDPLFDQSQADGAARALAGLSHTFTIGRDQLPVLAEQSGIAPQVGVSAQLWWANREAIHGDVNAQWFRGTELGPSYGGLPAWTVLRTVFGAAAFRLSNPSITAKLAAERTRRRIEQLERREQRGELDDEVIAAYESDLIALDSAERRVVELENEVERLQDDLLGMISSFDAAVGAERDEQVPGTDEFVPVTLAEAVKLAAERCTHLVFLDGAITSAVAWNFRRPGLVLDAFRKLDRIVERWQQDELHGGFTLAAKTAGLPWVPAISQTAQTQYREDYERTYEGDEIVLGPHLAWGNTADNALRAYFYIDRARRTVVVGHVGEHLRDTTKPHR